LAASLCGIVVGEEQDRNTARTYLQPKDATRNITDHVAF